MNREGERLNACLWGSILVEFKSILMHDPVRFLSIWSSSSIENEGFSHAYKFCLIVHRLVTACCFPKPSQGGSVSSSSCRILFIFVAEEIPLVLLFVSDPTFLCQFSIPSIFLSYKPHLLIYILSFETNMHALHRYY